MECNHSWHFSAKTLPFYKRLKTSMTISHKNKTLSTLLATLLGGLGAHRFYLYGKKDYWGWTSIFAFLLLSFAMFAPLPQTLFVTSLILGIISFFAGLIGALVIGLTPDEKWDAQFNAHSGRASNSGWAVILLVIITFAFGSTALIATIARGFNLYLTGGAFG
jgi:signal transduction histidine kinase